MIDRQHGKIVIECDACDTVYEGGSDEWAPVWISAKREGWKTRQIGSEWVHTCPDCKP